MVRRKTRSREPDKGVPAWMITFSDMVTLLMTFFIVLVSMASLTDVYKRKVAIGSVSGTFGTGAPSLDDLTTTLGHRDEQRLVVLRGEGAEGAVALHTFPLSPGDFRRNALTPHGSPRSRR